MIPLSVSHSVSLKLPSIAVYIICFLLVCETYLHTYISITYTYHIYIYVCMYLSIYSVGGAKMSVDVTGL